MKNISHSQQPSIDILKNMISKNKDIYESYGWAEIILWELDSAVEQIQALHSNLGWINVDEQLPEKEGNYIWYDIDDRGTVFEVTFEDGKFQRADNENIAFITHWQPLPQPPIT